MKGLYIPKTPSPQVSPLPKKRGHDAHGPGLRAEEGHKGRSEELLDRDDVRRTGGLWRVVEVRLVLGVWFSFGEGGFV